VNGTRARLEDPIVEAAVLVGREPWDSTRARFFESEGVSVLLSSRRRSRTGASDVWITVVAKGRGLTGGGPVTVTLAGSSGSRHGELDATGCCVIRDLPAGTYWIGVCRVHPSGGSETR
jgi:hypothetical protein